ncbi:MAG: 1,4-dihydroxy-2-naphthoate octaprenyltransferase [Bacteroidaceae bacterium]|nr:1,4-dihydroxy-2-naphthoate octaprenyltransferase [Bacteroidaceae bacterium]
MAGKWIEAMRLRTLPVSIAGVLAGCACALWQGSFSFAPAATCLLFALSAQIASNFGNEYYDFKNGVDRKGRDGFRRGVTEGDITPRAMKRATFIMLGITAAIGCSLLFYGSLWLIPVGLAILLFALAYSAGPYPLSHHGLGDVTVVIFFGIVPVSFTYYLQSGEWNGLPILLSVSVAIGMLAANVLIVNNYRDMEDDKAVGKRTTVVIFGRHAMGCVYLLSGIIAMGIMLPLWTQLPLWGQATPVVYLLLHAATWRKLIHSNGPALNPLLGRTAMNLLLLTLMLLAISVLKYNKLLLLHASI